MSLEKVSEYLLVGLVLLFFVWRRSRSNKTKALAQDWAKDGAIIVDVRSPAEYQQGARKGSINIPLDELTTRMNELDKSKPMILCCASGARSGRALQILKGHGFRHVINGGSWSDAP